jgi:hypothetical protein
MTRQGGPDGGPDGAADDGSGRARWWAREGQMAGQGGPDGGPDGAPDDGSGRARWWAREGQVAGQGGPDGGPDDGSRWAAVRSPCQRHVHTGLTLLHCCCCCCCCSGPSRAPCWVHRCVAGVCAAASLLCTKHQQLCGGQVHAGARNRGRASGRGAHSQQTGQVRRIRV